MTQIKAADDYVYMALVEAMAASDAVMSRPDCHTLLVVAIAPGCESAVLGGSLSREALDRVADLLVQIGAQADERVGDDACLQIVSGEIG